MLTGWAVLASCADPDEEYPWGFYGVYVTEDEANKRAEEVLACDENLEVSLEFWPPTDG